MRKVRGFLKWVSLIVGVCILAIILAFYKLEETKATKTVKPKYLNTAVAGTVKMTSYVGRNDQAYELIRHEKEQRSFANIKKEYEQEHPTKKVQVQDPPKKKVITKPTESKKEEKPKKKDPVSPPPKQNIPKGSKIVYLTIDDGPSAATGQITKILNQYHVTATFFMLEPNMRKYSGDLKVLAKDGFGLGLHGVTHNKNKFYQSTKTVVGEMKTDQATLQKITGVKTNLIRVPYGSVPYMTKEYREAEKDAGFIMWDWNVDSKDWYYKDQRYVSSTIQQLQKLKGKNEGAIILIHDLPTTARHLPKLLDYLKANHYVLKKIEASTPPYQFRPR